MKIQSRLFAVSLLLLLASCSGGGAASPDEEASTGSNWDEMIWDRDNWA